MEIISYSEKETFELGKKIGKEAKKGEIYALVGAIGVGKTVFSKGFALGLGIEDIVTSPTFTIMNMYEGRETLYHFDVYRISSIDEMEETGFYDYIGNKGISLIEWADMIEEVLPKETIWIDIQLDKENNRKITIEKRDRKS